MQIAREIHDALCLGISVLTGPMIDGAIEMATAAKKLRPAIACRLWWLASDALARPDAAEEFVDYVVRRQGEATFLEFVDALSAQKRDWVIAGLSWKCCRTSTNTMQIEPTDLLDALPIPAYDLVDFDAYERVMR